MAPDFIPDLEMSYLPSSVQSPISNARFFMYHPAAVPFINRALENWGGLNWEDRFHHNDRSRAQRGGIGASLQQGVVMSRKKAETHSVC